MASPEVKHQIQNGTVEEVRAFLTTHPEAMVIPNLLQLAIIANRLEIVVLLRELGFSNLEAKEVMNATIYHFAASRCSQTLAYLLRWKMQTFPSELSWPELRSQLIPEITSQLVATQQTALHMAATCGQIESMRILLEIDRGSLDRGDFDKCTPLHLAVLYAKEKFSAMEMCLQYYPDLEAKTVEGLTPINLTSDPELIRRLRCVGARPSPPHLLEDSWENRVANTELIPEETILAYRFQIYFETTLLSKLLNYLFPPF